MADANELDLLVGFAQNYMAGRRAGFTETANDSRDAERLIERLAKYKATPLPADAALADAVALLRRTYQNHWPSTEIKAFLAKIDAMPDAALRALSQPGVAQVPAVPMAAIETVLHFCSPHEDASKEDCSKCSAAYEEVSNWRDALLSAAPSAKGGE